MPGLTEQADSLHEALGEAGQKVSREAVEKVLLTIEEFHPEVTVATFDGIQVQVKNVILELIQYATQSAFGRAVVATLEDIGTLHKEEIPEELHMPQPVIEKLKDLRAPDDKLEIVAYILLNATSESDLANKTGAAHLKAGTAQFLVPIFYALANKDSGVRDRLLSVMSELAAYRAIQDVDGAVESFFSAEETAPDIELALTFGEVISEEEREKFCQTYVMTMLTLLKEYLQS
ncbi:MAG: hypothetical protein ABIG34_02515 [Candidatus Peregrinibacteria bacterium]